MTNENEHSLTGFITWLREWFYTKNEVLTLLSNASGGVSSYRSYEIIPSSYNVDLNDAISVAVTVRDMSGNPVSNENVSLFYTTPSLNSPVEAVGTTNSNGVATFSNLQMLDLGITDFRVGSEHCQIQVDGWKTQSLTNMSGCTLYYNNDFCALKINKSGLTVSSTNTYANIVTGTIPSAYRPAVPVVMRNEGTINIYFRVTDNGNVQMTSDYKPSASFTGKTMIIWPRS